MLNVAVYIKIDTLPHKLKIHINYDRMSVRWASGRAPSKDTVSSKHTQLMSLNYMLFQFISWIIYIPTVLSYRSKEEGWKGNKGGEE